MSKVIEKLNERLTEIEGPRMTLIGEITQHITGDNAAQVEDVLERCYRELLTIIEWVPADA